MSDSIHWLDFEVEDGACYSRSREAQEIVRPWGSEAGAWRRLGTHGWHPFWPQWTLQSLDQEVGDLKRTRGLQAVRRKQLAAYQFLLNSWPDSAKDIAGGFEEQWPVLQLMNVGGKRAGELIRSNPALGLLTAAFVCPRETGLTTESASEAEHLVKLKRRQIAKRIGFPDTEAAVRLLAKIPQSCLSLEVLACLRSLLAENAECSERLAHLPSVYSLILDVMADPVLRALFPFESLGRMARLKPEVITEDLLKRVLVLVDAHRSEGGPPVRFHSLHDLDQVPGQTAKKKRVRDCDFPNPPFPETSHMQAIRTSMELIIEGKEMRHCSATNDKYPAEVSRGSLYFYRLLEPERATVCLRRTGSGWSIDEVRGPGNRLVAESTLAVIQSWLATA